MPLGKSLLAFSVPDFLSQPLSCLPLADFLTSTSSLEEALDFLKIAFKKVNLEGFDIMATCRNIREGKYDKESGQEAADLLIRAFEENQVDYDKLDHKAKNAVYEALFFVYPIQGASAGTRGAA